LPVSRFDPVLVETFAGFVIPGLRQGSFRLGAPVHKPAGRSLLLGLASLGPFARVTEVDEIAHVRFCGNRME